MQVPVTKYVEQPWQRREYTERTGYTPHTWILGNASIAFRRLKKDMFTSRLQQARNGEWSSRRASARQRECCNVCTLKIAPICTCSTAYVPCCYEMMLTCNFSLVRLLVAGVEASLLYRHMHASRARTAHFVTQTAMHTLCRTRYRIFFICD